MRSTNNVGTCMLHDDGFGDSENESTWRHLEPVLHSRIKREHLRRAVTSYEPSVFKV